MECAVLQALVATLKKLILCLLSLWLHPELSDKLQIEMIRAYRPDRYEFLKKRRKSEKQDRKIAELEATVTKVNRSFRR